MLVCFMMLESVLVWTVAMFTLSRFLMDSPVKQLPNILPAALINPRRACAARVMVVAVSVCVSVR